MTSNLDATITTLAKEAAQASGTGHEKLRTLIREVAAAGVVEFDSHEFKLARKSLRDAMLEAGFTKSNASTMFSRAWDSLAEELGLGARGRAGVGGAGTHARNAAGDADAGKPDKAALSAAERKEIERAAVVAFLDKAGLTLAYVESVAMHAAELVKLQKQLPAGDAKSAVKDAGLAVRDAANTIAKALKAARVGTSDEWSAMATRIGEASKLESKPVDNAKPAVKSAKPAVKPAKPAKSAKPAKRTPNGEKAVQYALSHGATLDLRPKPAGVAPATDDAAAA